MPISTTPFLIDGSNPAGETSFLFAFLSTETGDKDLVTFNSGGDEWVLLWRATDGYLGGRSASLTPLRFVYTIKRFVHAEVPVTVTPSEETNSYLNVANGVSFNFTQDGGADTQVALPVTATIDRSNEVQFNIIATPDSLLTGIRLHGSIFVGPVDNAGRNVIVIEGDYSNYAA